MNGEDSQRAPEPAGGWQFKPDDRTGAASSTGASLPLSDTASYEPAITHDDIHPKPKHDANISWSASEFIAHQKSFGWYALLILIAAAIAAAIFLLTKDKISTVMVIVIALVFGYAAARKPRTLVYQLDESGLKVGTHNFYDYGQFRSFAIMEEGPFSCIIFMPLKRFMPLLTVYYDPRDEQQIVGILSDRLPMETHQLDFIERLMRKVRY